MFPPDFRWNSVGTAPFDQPSSLLLDSTKVLRLHCGFTGPVRSACTQDPGRPGPLC